MRSSPKAAVPLFLAEELLARLVLVLCVVFSEVKEAISIFFLKNYIARLSRAHRHVVPEEGGGFFFLLRNYSLVSRASMFGLVGGSEGGRARGGEVSEVSEVYLFFILLNEK